MHVTVNGENRDVPGDFTIRQLLDTLDVPRQGVAVEVNREIVPRGEHDSRALADGGVVEIVTFVGGG